MCLTNFSRWKRALAFGATMLASSAMNNIFVTYSLDYFRNWLRVPALWFVIGQIIYLVWNAANDPLFGWLSDTTTGASCGALCSAARRRSPTGVHSALARRQSAIRYGGAIWAGAFALVWLPWATYAAGPVEAAEGGPLPAFSAAGILAGIHFIVSLCLYDGALTFVEVNHAAVLAEMSTSPRERADANMMAAVAAALGSVTSVAAHLCYDRADLSSFRVLSVCIAVLSMLAFEVSATGIGWEGETRVAGLAEVNRVTPIMLPAGAASLAPSGTQVPGGAGAVLPASASTGALTVRASMQRAGSFGRVEAAATATAAVPAGSEFAAVSPAVRLGEAYVGPELVDDGAGVALAGPLVRRAATKRALGRASPRASAIAAAAAAAGDAKASGPDAVSTSSATAPSSSSSSSVSSYIRFLRQVFSSRNLVIFILVSAVQTFDCTLEKAFFAPFSDIIVAAADATATLRLPPSSATLMRSGGSSSLFLNASVAGPTRLLLGDEASHDSSRSLSDASATSAAQALVMPMGRPSAGELGASVASRHARSVIISLSFLLPHALTVVWTPLISDWGMHKTLTAVFSLRLGVIAVAGAYYSSQPANSVAAARGGLAFLLANRVLSESVCRLFPLVLSDLIDEDTATHRRAQTLSASLVGASAVFSKASQSLAPLLAYHWLPANDGLGAILAAPGHHQSQEKQTAPRSASRTGGKARRQRAADRDEPVPPQSIADAVEGVVEGGEAAIDGLLPLPGVEDAADGVEDAVAAIAEWEADHVDGDDGPSLPSAAAAAAEAAAAAHAAAPGGVTDADRVAAQLEVRAVLPARKSFQRQGRRGGGGNSSSGHGGGKAGAAARRAAREAALTGLSNAAGSVWWLLLAVPPTCVVIQLIAWRWCYTLHGRRLATVKAAADRLAAEAHGVHKHGSGGGGGNPVQPHDAGDGPDIEMSATGQRGLADSEYSSGEDEEAADR